MAFTSESELHACEVAASPLDAVDASLVDVDEDEDEDEDEDDDDEPVEEADVNVQNSELATSFESLSAFSPDSSKRVFFGAEHISSFFILIFKI